MGRLSAVRGERRGCPCSTSTATIHRLSTRPGSDDSRTSSGERDRRRSRQIQHRGTVFALPTARRGAPGRKNHRRRAQRRSGPTVQYRHRSGDVRLCGPPRAFTGRGKSFASRACTTASRTALLEQASRARKGRPRRSPGGRCRRVRGCQRRRAKSIIILPWNDADVLPEAAHARRR